MIQRKTQEEFRSDPSDDQMDLLLCAFLRNVSPAEAGEPLDLSAVQVERVYRDIAAKRRKAAELSQTALLAGDLNDN